MCVAGRLCSCIEGARGAAVREGCGSREDYEESLECSCDESGEPAILTWTPDENTPDTLYYQVISLDVQEPITCVLLVQFQ